MPSVLKCHFTSKSPKEYKEPSSENVNSQFLTLSV